MRWTRRGAEMLLHARCALLNGELGNTPMVALRIIAGAGGGCMNPQVLSSPQLSTKNTRYSPHSPNFAQRDTGRFARRR